MKTPISASVLHRTLLACGVIGAASTSSASAITQPVGNNATVRLVSIDHTSGLLNPTVSVFLVDFGPGGSALLHRQPSSGCVLVHVLSGEVTAWAWNAGVGIYRAGETWAEPAFAYDITARNASAEQSARALVLLVTDKAE